MHFRACGRYGPTTISHLSLAHLLAIETCDPGPSPDLIISSEGEIMGRHGNATNRNLAFYPLTCKR